MKYLVLCDWPGSSSFDNEIIQGIEEYCNEKDYSLLTMALGEWGSDYQYDKSRNQLYDLINQDQFDGIISFSTSIPLNSDAVKYHKYLTGLTTKPIINLIEQVPKGYSVVFENRKAFKELLHHLCKFHGYRDFAYISGGLDNPDSRIRLECIKEVLTEYQIDLPEEKIFFGEWTIHSGIDGYKELKKFNPRVIVCANDYMALGVYNEAFKDGLNIPGDLVITGYDNISADGFHDLPFTTVKQPFRIMGHRASQMLDELIHQRQIAWCEEIPTKLIIKESCGCWYKQEESPNDSEIQTYFEWAGTRLNQALKEDIENPQRNYLIRCWNSLMQQCFKFSLSEQEILSFFNDVITDWHKNIEDKETLIFLNLKVAQ
ncbi:MAG: LacI family DNA-binding transcriptional regulator, partial [Spirochaetaceae bacterium]|nr:LacI family DNA-binding transcriptional regulator [Spirochaetaceae bacterium]